MRDKVAAEEQRKLRELRALLDDKRFRIERYVRVACPARGTALLSDNLDVFLSGLLSLTVRLAGMLAGPAGSTVLSAFQRIVLEIADKRVEPELVPGIEAMCRVARPRPARRHHARELRAAWPHAPRRVEGETLWDGGLGCSAPIEQWIDDPDVTHIVVHSILHHVQIRAREHSDRRNFTSAMLAAHQLTADELLHWKIELARRAGKTVIAVETITPRPRIGIPITFWPPKPWPEHARDLMALGAASAHRALG